MPEPMPVRERVRKATEARVRNAQRRRFQRHVAAMRAAGLSVIVMQPAADPDTWQIAPDYTEEAVAAAVADQA